MFFLRGVRAHLCPRVFACVYCEFMVVKNLPAE